MIKLKRPNVIPEILIEKAEEWTEGLMSLVTKYGEYEKIPEKEKKAAVSFYRHDDIKSSLFSSSFRKCAFCETFPEDSGYLEIEHFHPKAKHPEKTFQWENFLPCCRTCNGKKGQHDTVKEPILNPYDVNPDDFLEVDFLKLKAKNNNGIASRTLKICGLNSTRLYRPRSEICKTFSQYEDELENHLEEYEQLKTPITKNNKLKRIQESIEVIETLKQEDSAHSFFCKFLIERSDIFIKAKQLTSILSS